MHTNNTHNVKWIFVQLNIPKSHTDWFLNEN